MFDKRIDISPPKAFVIEFGSTQGLEGLDSFQKMVKIAFRMEIGSLIDSEIMQLVPLKFAKDLVDNLLNMEANGQSTSQSFTAPSEQTQQQQSPKQAPSFNQGSQQQQNQNLNFQQEYETLQGDGENVTNAHSMNRGPVNVQPAQFQTFDEGKLAAERKNISLIMDVPLQVTVELGRTQKLIKDILEFGPGSIIELDKLAGEPVDILVNGKYIAKGEVVVIDESFGVRIIDIIHPSKRL
jgi:flagellar motor switch protein FliN/FliY